MLKVEGAHAPAPWSWRHHWTSYCHGASLTLLHGPDQLAPRAAARGPPVGQPCPSLLSFPRVTLRSHSKAAPPFPPFSPLVKRRLSFAAWQKCGNAQLSRVSRVQTLIHVVWMLLKVYTNYMLRDVVLRLLSQKVSDFVTGELGIQSQATGRWES